MVPSTPANDALERIEDIDVSTEMRDSFLEYAYSVIYSRALPDARDGLKPVQRRILFMMSEMGLRPDKGHVKSARVVGEVMGKLHPHGDASIYDALVRLAQDFSLRLPLIDGHGNFGSLDDGPAAARYTEARLAASALAMTANLDEDVVDFVPNYDNQFQQPDVLPSAYPNLLVNGASGIAVGMATNMAPHNLIEVIEASIHLLRNPQASLDDLMAFVPGPDLPSGGVIMGLDGIREAYETGRGSFKTRARVNELLDLVGLDPSEYGSRYPKQLSGGQQQRVGVARALAADPAVLLMDEPFGATDPITRVRLQKEFRALQRELKKTVVFVTHDFEEALLLGDRIAVLSEQSKVEQYGTPLEILSAPATKKVESFVGEAASVRMLGLVSLASVSVASGNVDGPTLSETATLREAMEGFITGAKAINVGTRGHLTFEALQSAISQTRAGAR